MASGLEFETSDAFAYQHLEIPEPDLPTDDVKILMKVLKDACRDQRHLSDTVSSYLTQAIAAARVLPHGLSSKVALVTAQIFEPIGHFHPGSPRVKERWLDELDKIVHDWGARRPPRAAEEEVDDAEPAHPQAMQALPSPRKRKLPLRGSVRHSHGPDNGPKRQKTPNAPNQMSSVGGKSDNLDSEDEEDEDSSGSQGIADDVVEEAAESDEVVHHARHSSAFDRSPLEFQSSRDGRLAFFDRSPSPLANATSAVVSAAATDSEVEAQEVDSPRYAPRHAAPPFNIRHAQPETPSKHHDDDTAALSDVEIYASGTDYATEIGDNEDEITSTADVDGVEDSVDVDDESLRLRRRSSSATPATEQPRDGQDSLANGSNADSPVVATAGVRVTEFAREQQVTKVAPSPVPQDEQLLAGPVEPVSGSENEPDRFTTPRGQTTLQDFHWTPISHNISKQYRKDNLEALRDRVAAQVTGRTMTSTKNNKEVRTLMAAKDAVEITNAFFADFIDGIHNRAKEFLEGVKTLPSIVNDISNSNDPIPIELKRIGESLPALIEMDRKKGVTQIRRTVLLAHFARAREKFAGGDKRISEHFGLDPNEYKEYAKCAELARILEKAWGPGALLFMAIDKKHLFAQVVEVIKQEDEVDILTKLATILYENMFKPVEEEQDLSRVVTTGAICSDYTIEDMFPTGRRLLN